MEKETSTNNTSDNNNVVVISSRDIRTLVRDATNIVNISLLNRRGVVNAFMMNSGGGALNEGSIIEEANQNINLNLSKLVRGIGQEKHNSLLDNNRENYLKLLELIIEKIIDKKAGDFEKGGNDYKDLINLKRVEDSNIFIYFNWFKNIENDGLRINYLKAIMETIKCELEKTKTNGSYTYYYLLHDKDIINLNSNQHVSKAYCSFEELKKDLNFIDNKEREEEVKSFLNINDDNPNLFLSLFQHQKEDKAYSFLTNEIKPNNFNSPRDLQNKIIAFIIREHETARGIEALYEGYRQGGEYNFKDINLDNVTL